VKKKFFPFFLILPISRAAPASTNAVQDGVPMRLIQRLLIVLPLILGPTAASAISLTNHDTADRKLIVIEGDTQNERVIKAGEKLDLCDKSCVIRLPDGEDYEFDGPEVVSLQDGLLYLTNAGDQGTVSGPANFEK
jgi:hypothetical protein